MRYFINVNLSLQKGAGSGGSDKKPPTPGFKRWDREFPQFEIWFIVSMNPTGTYNIRNKNNSQQKRGVNCITRAPLSFEEGDPCVVGYYDCDRRKPYIIGMQGSAGTAPAVPDPEVPMYNWICQYQSYNRKHAWTGNPAGSGEPIGSGDAEIVFDYETAVPDVVDVGLEEGGFRFDRWEGPNHILGRTSDITLTIDDDSLLENTYFLTLQQAMEDSPVYDEVAFVENSQQLLSVSLSEGFCYILFAYQLEGIEDYYPTAWAKYEMAVSYEESFLGEAYLDRSWMQDSPAYLSNYAYFSLGEADLTVSGGRICLLTKEFSEGTAYFFHYDLDGNDQQYEYFEFGYGAGGFQILNGEGRKDWRIFAKDNIVVLSIGTRLVGYDLETNTVLWKSEDTAADYVLSPTHMFGSTILCGFEKAEYQTIDDLRMTVDLWDPIVVTDPRVEYKEGLAIKAGICAINLSSGAVVNETLFTGEELLQEVSEAYEDYLAELPDMTWVFPTYKGEPGFISDEYTYKTAFSVAKHARFHYFFEFPDVTLDDIDWDTFITDDLYCPDYFSIYSTASTYNDTLGSAIPWLEDVVAYINGTWTDQQKAMGYSIQSSRLDTKDVICADMIRIPEMDVRLHNSGDIFSEFGTTHLLTGLDIQVSNKLYGDDSIEEPVIYPDNLGFYLPDPRAEYNDKTPDPSGFFSISQFGYNGFEEWWITRQQLAEEEITEDPYEDLYTYGYFNPSGNDPYNITRRIIWRHYGDTYEANRTVAPKIRVGPGCSNANIAVYGPRVWNVSTGPLEWQGWSKDGALLWTDTVTSEDYYFPGTPVLVGELVFTFVQVGEETCSLYVHEIASGSRVATVTDINLGDDGYLPLITEVTFNGETFYSIYTNTTFGPDPTP